MDERLTFGYRRLRTAPGTLIDAPPLAGPVVSEAPRSAAVAGADADDTRSDYAFIGLMAFTALLFFRPQDELPILDHFHLAEIAALFALAAMVMGRLRRGLSFATVTPELAGVVALGAIILLTAPFSVWMGGAVSTFTCKR